MIFGGWPALNLSTVLGMLVVCIFAMVLTDEGSVFHRQIPSAALRLHSRQWVNDVQPMQETFARCYYCSIQLQALKSAEWSRQSSGLDRDGRAKEASKVLLTQRLSTLRRGSSRALWTAQKDLQRPDKYQEPKGRARACADDSSRSEVSGWADSPP